MDGDEDQKEDVMQMLQRHQRYREEEDMLDVEIAGLMPDQVKSEEDQKKHRAEVDRSSPILVAGVRLTPECE